MPDSRLEAEAVTGRLREHLRTLLPMAEISQADSALALPPLLLLQTTHNLVAFALPNGDWRANYETLYEGFKDLCNRRQREWEQLDVNFVFCLPQPDSDFDAFCSKIETDVYFCRKFVIPLDGDMPQALARLPFLPLDPLQGGGLRPDSAQVFLQRHGVSALLARYLVLPHQRGPEEIVNDCIAQQFGEPVVLPAMPRTGATAADRSQEPIRIEKIEIENFRAYRKPQSFDIASDITVLYGPNGFGKTSFFDAIDFAVTGDIGRLDGLTDSQFQKAATHLDSEPGKSTVTMTASNNGGSMRVERTVKARNRATLNGDQKDRKNILAALTGTGSPGTERIDHLVRLFRATHQFNQEEQELTREFQKDCRLSADIVSRMLAFEDYNNAVSKTEKVHAHLVQIIAGHDATILDAQTLATADREELRRLSQPTQIDGSASTLQEAIASVRTRLTAAGFSAEEASVDTSVVRGWRAAVAARHADHASKARRLTELAKDLALLPTTRLQLETRSQALFTKEEEQVKVDADRASAELASQRADQTVTEHGRKLKELTVRNQLLEWIRSTKPRYAEAVALEKKLGEALESLAIQLREQRTAEEKLSIEVQAAETAISQRHSKSAALQQQLKLFTTLLETHSRYVDQSRRLGEVDQAGRAVEKELADLQPLQRKHTQEQSEFTAEEKRLDTQIKQATTQQSDLKQLLTDLAGHIHTGVCPICAADYGAKEKLLQRIQTHSNAEVASEPRQRLQQIREKIAVAKEGLIELSARKLAAEQRQSALQTEKTQIEAALKIFMGLVEGTGLFPDSPAGHFADELRRRITALNAEIAQHDAPTTEHQRVLTTLREALAANRQVSRQKQFEQDEKSKTLTTVRAELARMRADPRLGQSSLDIDLQQLAEVERLASEELARANESLKTAESAAALRKTAFATARQIVVALRPEIQNLRAQIAANKKWISDFEARLKASDLSPTLTPDALADLVKTESQLQAEVAMLGESTANLELALDAATTAAALSRLTDNIHAADKRKVDAESERQRLKPWTDYFDELRALLSAQQNNAIATFTREYGPRASVIQRRLRSVYGFEDIILRPDKSDIVVRATRRGEPLRPIDYFSQSQQQTLLLSLFLTACSSQTWSNFCPVLLDDPVTHFDDLNTYAFLDLLVGLLDARSGPRQFILSTCDDRLFQLARQKFRHLGSRAAFYTFISSGKDGPQIEAVTLS
jgi:DNA repair protein SbcC/Rad50